MKDSLVPLHFDMELPNEKDDMFIQRTDSIKSLKEFY